MQFLKIEHTMHRCVNRAHTHPPHCGLLQKKIMVIGASCENLDKVFEGDKKQMTNMGSSKVLRMTKDN